MVTSNCLYRWYFKRIQRMSINVIFALPNVKNCFWQKWIEETSFDYIWSEYTWPSKSNLQNKYNIATNYCLEMVSLASSSTKKVFPNSFMWNFTMIVLEFWQSKGLYFDMESFLLYPGRETLFLTLTKYWCRLTFSLRCEE